MKYNLFFLFFLLSCTSYSNNLGTESRYSASGFAYIEENLTLNLNNDNFYVSQNKLRLGSKIKIVNPNNNKFLELKIKKKIKYDNFYKVLISKNIADKLELSLDFPFVEVYQIKSNKSFVAKKAITDIEEKKIANKAPIEKININNISKEKKYLNKKVQSYSILVAEFYNYSSAQLLKDRLSSVLKDSNYHLIYINKKNKNKYQLLMGPYNTINKLKNDYIVLSDSNFEDLDIKTND